MTRHRWVALWVGLAVLALVGCTGSGGRKPSPTPPPATPASGGAAIPGLSEANLRPQARSAVPDGVETTKELKGAPDVRLISKADAFTEIEFGPTGAGGVSDVLCASGKATGSAGRLKVLRVCVALPVAGLDQSGAQAWLDRITINQSSTPRRSSFTASGLHWTSSTVNGFCSVDVVPAAGGSGAASATVSPTL